MADDSNVALDAAPTASDLADATQAEALNNDFIKRQQQLLYTDPDAFYGKQGEDALAATPGILDRLQRLRQEIFDAALTPGIRQRLGSALDSHMVFTRESVLRHTRREALAYRAATARNRVDLLTKQAGLDYNDPDSVALYADMADGAARVHARATDGDPDATAQAAISSIWRNAIESALARDDAGAAGTLHQQATDALSPADNAIVANQIAAAQKHLTGQTYTSGLPLPVPNPAEPLDAERALAAIDAAHQAATSRNAADFVDDPNQQATNKHFIDVRFGTAKRAVVRRKADLDAKVADWLAQPGQTERPPLAVWTQLSPNDQRAVDAVLVRNAGPSFSVAESPLDDQFAQSIPPSFFARPPVIPEVPRQLKVPVPGLSGKEGATDTPSFGKGIRPFVGEKGEAAAERVMDKQWGEGRWRSDPDRMKEFRKLQKYYDRHFQDPSPRKSLPPSYDEPGDIPGGERIA